MNNRRFDRIFQLSSNVAQRKHMGNVHWLKSIESEPSNKYLFFESELKNPIHPKFVVPDKEIEFWKLRARNISKYGTTFNFMHLLRGVGEGSIGHALIRNFYGISTETVCNYIIRIDQLLLKVLRKN